MKDIAIFGAGGLGREVACLIERINRKEKRWHLIGFFDDEESLWGKENEYGRILGGSDMLNVWQNPIDIVISIGNPKAIKRIHEKLLNDKIDFPNIIDPTFDIVDADNYQMGQGNIIQRTSSISINVKIGSFNILNGSDFVGHDSILGDYNVIMPDVRISGGVHIGNGNLLGVGSIVIQQMSIGNNSTLAAGSVLMTKAKKEGLYIGVPAKRLEL